MSVNSLLELENNIYHPNHKYMAIQPHITEKMRVILVDWLLEVFLMFKLNKLSISYAITILDTYLSLKIVARESLQAIGCMCLNIACHISEIYQPELGDYVYITDGAYTNKQLNEHMMDIIYTLNGNIYRPSVKTFVQAELLPIEGEEYTKMFETLDRVNDVNYLCYISYYFTKYYKPSLIAYTIIYLVSGKISGYTYQEMANVCNEFHSIIEKSSKTTLEFLKKTVSNLSKNILNKCSETAISIQKKYIKAPRNKNDTFKKCEKINEYLGEGTYGQVWKTKCSDKIYAVKQLDDYASALTEMITYRLLGEFIYINQLSGFLFEITKDGSNINTFLFMEIADFNLANAVTKNLIPLDDNSIRKYYYDILKGIEYCNRYDVITGDIKPQNILCSKDTNNNIILKIIDFGLAQFDVSIRNAQYHNIYTATYRAPELFLQMKYTTNVDVWALGMIYWFIVTKTDNVWDIISAVSVSNEMYILSVIFNFLGKPKKDEWPELYDNKNYTDYFTNKKVDNLDYDFYNLLGEHYELIMACLIINPEKRPSSHALLECSEKFYPIK